MTRQLSDQILLTLRGRAGAFRSHVEAMRAESSSAPSAFRDALDLVQLYTRCLIEHVENQWAASPNEFVRQVIGKEGLADLQMKELEVDRIFARSGQSSIPRSLARRVAEEFAAHDDLPSDLRPVLTVGRPGNFETYEEDLRGFLFHNLWNSSYDGDPAYRDGRFAVITVPYLEGSRAFWEPLVLGHEVGHIAVYYRGSQDVPGIRDKKNSYLLRLADEIGIESDSGMAINWLKELLCDLNMCRLYGPAGVLALADMLTVSEDALSFGEMSRSTHPPRSLRIEMALDAVGPFAPGDPMTRVIQPWKELVDEPLLAGAVEALMMDFRQVAGRLWEEVGAWAGGDRYDYTSRRQEVRWLASRIGRGLPGGMVEEGGVHSPLSAEGFRPQDIVNAAWVAVDGGLQDEPRLVDSEADIDRLALKALDNAEFSALWQRNNGRLESDAYLEPAGPIGSAGQLSSVDIKRRLAATGPKQLVITPLLERSIQDAGVDVRLASSFVVFKHSATSVFDAVRAGQDPRDMQETVEKEWGERFILHPDELVLAATLEYIVVPQDLAGQLNTRSSYGRVGLLTATAIQVQPGSAGVITLELVNLSRTPLALRAGQRIGQLVLHQLATPLPDDAKPSSQHYRWPTGPEFSKVRNDWDNTVIRDMRDMLKQPVDAPMLAESVVPELERLDELRQRGVLTPEEFQAQKARLLR